MTNGSRRRERNRADPAESDAGSLARSVLLPLLVSSRFVSFDRFPAVRFELSALERFRIDSRATG